MNLSRWLRGLRASGSGEPTDQRIVRWFWLAIVTVLLALAIDQPLLVALGLLLAIATLAAYCWWRFGLRAVRVQRTIGASHASFGDEIELAIVIENEKPLPLIWLEILDEVPEPDRLTIRGASVEKAEGPGRYVMRSTFSVGPYERVRRRHTIVCAARGWYRLGPTTLVTGDPFGFTRRSVVVSSPVDLIVFPEVRPLAAFRLPSDLPMGKATPIRPLFDDPYVVEGIRPYQVGDHPRQLHWRASARAGSLQSKRYERTASPALMIALDVNTFEHFWEGFDSELLELSISVAASVGADALERGLQVGLISNALLQGTSRHTRVAPGASRGQLPRLLEALAMLVGGTGVRIEQLLTAESRRLPWGSTFVVVTTRVTDPLQATLLALARRGMRPVVILCGDREDEFPLIQGRIDVFRVGLAIEEEGYAPLPLAI
jgi:uncharacterized protein (DUF58 family)